MKNKKNTMPAGMLFKRFCHHCGTRLEKCANTRTVKRGDSDYEEHRRIGRTRVIGDVEVTEYTGYECPNCKNQIAYDEQIIISNIQKKLGKKVLSEEEIEKEKVGAQIKQKRKDTANKIIFFSIIFILFALTVYFVVATGKIDIKFYF